MDMTNLAKHLPSLETPFNWNIPTSKHQIDLFIKTETEKLDNSNEESNFQWMKFLLNLLLGYEYWEKKKNSDRALKHINSCEEHIDQLTRSGCCEQLFAALKPALWHVTLATKLHVLQESNTSFSEAEKQKMMKGILPISQMNRKERAGIAGIKAGVYLQYGTPGHRLSLESARHASELDPNQAEWWFLIGNALGRLRRIENNKEISREEIEMIEKAIKLQQDASYIVNLAQLYAEFSSQLFFSKSDPGNLEKSKMYAKKAVQTFEKAVTLRPNCAVLLARTAHGLMKIKCREALDIKYIKKLLQTLVEMTPNNSMAFQDLGIFYERYEKDTNKAMKCFEKSNELFNEKALLSMTCLKWKTNMDGQIIEDLENGLAKYLDHENQAELNTQLGSCLILIQKDWENAVRCFSKCLELDPSAKYLKSFGGFTGKRVDMLKIVTTELLLGTPRTNHVSLETRKNFLAKSKLVDPNTFSNYQLGRNLYIVWEKDQFMVKTQNKSKNRF